MNIFQERLTNSIEHYDDCRHSAKFLDYKFYIYNNTVKIPDERLQDFKMDCYSLPANISLFTHRIIGIPSVIDFIPHFANRNGRHYWAAIFDSKYQSLKVVQADMYRAAKIYRQTYAPPTCRYPQAAGNMSPPFSGIPSTKTSPRNISRLRMSPSACRGGTGAKHAYLAIFNDLTWKPIACAEVSDRKACFRHMGQGCGLSARLLQPGGRNAPR